MFFKPALTPFLAAHYSPALPYSGPFGRAWVLLIEVPPGWRLVVVLIELFSRAVQRHEACRASNLDVGRCLGGDVCPRGLHRAIPHSLAKPGTWRRGGRFEPQTKLIGNFAVPFGTNYIRIEGPVLVTGLPGTGSDPPPGPQPAALLADMEAHNVANPRQLLASPNNSLAWARAYIPPGVRKGDPLDIEVRVPAQSDTTSIRGGFMMETRLEEMAVLAGQVRKGRVLAVAEGPVLVDPVAHGSTDNVSQMRGVVLGGGKALKDRTMGLVLRESDKSVYLSKEIGNALNRRFHTYSKGMKQGVATPKTDAFIELEVHPRYKYNLGRYLQVVRSVALFESPQQQLERLQLLERQLLDPVTSAQAALRLEAIGKTAANGH